MLGGRVVVDTSAAAYVWDTPKYPRYAFPLADARVDELAGVELIHEPHPGFGELVTIPWAALDRWYEEEEQIYVHPRNPYARVDALRTSRHVRVQRDGVLLAESHNPVVLFETGLPPRTYFDRTAVEWSALTPSPTQTACPYKGRTTEYWSFVTPKDGRVVPDIAWSYAFPLPAVAAIAGLVSFYDERVDVWVDGVAQERPSTGS